MATATYDEETLAAFGYTSESLVVARKAQLAEQEEYERSCVPPHARPVYNEAKSRFEIKPVYKCPCRMCAMHNPSDAKCRLCGAVAYSGKHLVTERMCARCGHYCAKCIALHPEYMVPEEWMFLTCVPCLLGMSAKRDGASSSSKHE